MTQVQTLPVDEVAGELEPVVEFDGPMPTGVSVSHRGRIFINFPKWGDQKDLRRTPYSLFRVHIDAQPVLLR